MARTDPDSPMITASVIITTYNRPDTLRVVLQGFSAQDCACFEVLIADDGSTQETAQLLADLRPQLPFPLIHVWQEDRGFRAAQARNRALARAQGDYVIFVDGDCVPLPGFVSAHLRLAQSGWFVAGNRLLLSRKFSQRVLEQRIAVHVKPRTFWLYARARGWINRFAPLFTLPDNRFRCARPTEWRGAKTCNLGAWREDLLRVNGLDERYEGWGHEDADLAVRLIRAGIRRKDGRFGAPVLHLWHAEHDRSLTPENIARLNQVLAGTEIRAVRGVDQYLPSGT